MSTLVDVTSSTGSLQLSQQQDQQHLQEQQQQASTAELLHRLQYVQRSLRVIQKAQFNAIRTIRTKLVSHESLILKVVSLEKAVRGLVELAATSVATAAASTSSSDANGSTTTTRSGFAFIGNAPFGYSTNEQYKRLMSHLRNEPHWLGYSLARSVLSSSPPPFNASDRAVDKKQLDHVARALVNDIYGKQFEKELLTMIRFVCFLPHGQLSIN
jgi:hypothetical protein